jgi:hypothetical protein
MRVPYIREMTMGTDFPQRRKERNGEPGIIWVVAIFAPLREMHFLLPFEARVG